MFALKELRHRARSDEPRLSPGRRPARCRAAAPATCSTRRSPASRQADACLLVGTNPRWEASLVNARLRKRYLQGGFRVAAIGPALDLTFPVEMLGDGGETLNALARGDHPWAEIAARRARRR